MKKKPVSKPAKKKPAKPKSVSDLALIAYRLGELMEDTRLINEAIRDVSRDIARPPSHSAFGDFKLAVDRMGRSISEQIHLLAKELPPNKHDAMAMKLDQLERRVALLEREATYTVRHVIDTKKPTEENHDPELREESQN